MPAPFPASEATVITVVVLADSDGQLGGYGTSTPAGDADDTLALFSNFGEAVDFLVPGSGVCCLDLDNQLSKIDGTCVAAAHVSGVVGGMASEARRSRRICSTAVRSDRPRTTFSRVCKLKCASSCQVPDASDPTRR